MRTVFVDTSYWIAVTKPKDRLSVIARKVSLELRGSRLETSEMILAEFLNALCGNAGLREMAAECVRHILSNPNVVVLPQTRDLFREALARYKERTDKTWSLTDCASFVLMERRGIYEALTEYRHFAQAGFKPLLRQDES